MICDYAVLRITRLSFVKTQTLTEMQTDTPCCCPLISRTPSRLYEQAIAQREGNGLLDSSLNCVAEDRFWIVFI